MQNATIHQLTSGGHKSIPQGASSAGQGSKNLTIKTMQNATINQLTSVGHKSIPWEASLAGLRSKN
jgi:hypothetical protein